MRRELCIDLFCGGGGASEGIEAAGLHVDIGVNHSPDAIRLHTVNHRHCRHYCQDVFAVDPKEVVGPRDSVGLLWASASCTHFSKAKGGQPLDTKIRDLATVVTDRWIPELGDRAPRIIMMENVPEFLSWGPLDEKFRPFTDQKGEYFLQFTGALNKYGYKVDWRILTACNYGVPTSREQLFLVARRDGEEIRWPYQTHYHPKFAKILNRPSYVSASEVIDWSLPCPSIFATSKEIFEQYGVRAVRPLAEKTLRRLGRKMVHFLQLTH